MAKEAHPLEVLDELRGSLAGALAPGYVVRGEELYYRNAALDLLRSKARGEKFEICTHDTRDVGFDPLRLQDDFVGGGLFAAGRLVVLHAPEELLKKDAGKERPVARAIAKFLVAKAGSVVLVAEGLRADHPTVKAIVSSGGRLCSFRKLYDKPAPWERSPDPRRTETSEWVIGRAKELGLALSADQAVLLVAAVGADLCALESKLVECSHSTGADFFRDLEAAAPVSPFELSASISRGDLRASLREIEGLFHSGFKSRDGKLEVKPDALREILFSGLRSQVRRGLFASEAMRLGRPADEAAREAGVSAFQMRDFQAALGARDASKWRAMSDDLARLERKARTGHAVDANDFAMFAVRWRRARTATRA